MNNTISEFLKNIKQNRVLEEIPISKLAPSKLNTYEICDLDDLTANIKSCGLITPLTVYKDKSSKYEILSGERRYKALLSINSENPELYSEVPCYVIKDENDTQEMDDLYKSLIIETSNLETREFNKNQHRIDMLKIIKKIGEKNDAKRKEIVNLLSNQLKISDRYARMYTEIVEADNDELEKQLVDGKITAQEASIIAGMKKEEQNEVVDRVNQGERASKIINEKREEKKQNKEKKLLKEEEEFNKLVNSDNIDEINAMLNEFSPNIKGDISSVGLIPSSEVTHENYTENKNKKKEIDTDLIITFCYNMMDKVPGQYSKEEENVFEVMKELLDYLGRL